MLVFLVENPPVPKVEKEWHIASNQLIPAIFSKIIWITVSAR